ncbi:MAG: hypothetical protein KGY65_05770 [Candidatus Thermoplasmatota archaeon]|nr:hypothetical protein [Candidatus Thermoplasmatota archaeon]MBS3802240.1 hypothetical protein [Candidatus Thermoplasmatota archaeon]
MDDSTNESNQSTDKDDMEKRRPKPFRYIKKLSELPVSEDLFSETVMSTKSDFTVEKLIEQFDSVVGVGDVQTIERVVQKHEKRNKKDDPSIG